MDKVGVRDTTVSPILREFDFCLGVINQTPKAWYWLTCRICQQIL